MEEIKSMKSFGKFFSVLLLSLFCSFFVGMDVFAETTAGAQTVTLPDATLQDQNIRFLYSNPTNVVIPAHSEVLEMPGITIKLFEIPETKVGQEYVVTFQFGKLFAFNTISGLPSLSSNQYLFVGTSSSFADSVRLGSSSYPVAGAGPFEFMIDALDGTTPVYLFFSDNLSSLPTSGTANFSFPDVPASGYVFSSNAVIASAPFSNLSYTLQVGGDDLLDAVEHQTDVIQKEMDKVNNSLTKFEGSSDMDASKEQLAGVMSDYDQIEGSLFDSGQAAFDQFDPQSLLSFSAGITAAIAQISQLMIGIISAMGEFSVIYTVGVVLVFFGMLIGLWRFFK